MSVWHFSFSNIWTSKPLVTSHVLLVVNIYLLVDGNVSATKQKYCSVSLFSFFFFLSVKHSENFCYRLLFYKLNKSVLKALWLSCTPRSQSHFVEDTAWTALKSVEYYFVLLWLLYSQHWFPNSGSVPESRSHAGWIKG